MAAYVDRLGRALAMVVDAADPDVIVLGGRASNIDALYTLVPPLVAEHGFGDALDIQIRRHWRCDSIGVRGAAWLWGRDGG